MTGPLVLLCRGCGHTAVVAEATITGGEPAQQRFASPGTSVTITAHTQHCRQCQPPLTIA